MSGSGWGNNAFGRWPIASLRSVGTFCVAIGLTTTAAACVGVPSDGSGPVSLTITASPGTPEPASTPTAVAAQSVAYQPDCERPPIVVPTLPADPPGFVQLDPATGLHVTGRARAIDPEDYRLDVVGMVENRLSLTYGAILCMPQLADAPLLVCPGFFEDQAEWSGVSLAHILDLAVPDEEATGIRLVSADRYEAIVTLDNARETGAFLAYEWEGGPLPILHGFPVRAVFPTLEGNKWVKWLVKVEVF